MNNFIYSYLLSKGIIWQQISSFDYFVTSDLKKILNNSFLQNPLYNTDFKFSYNSIKIQNAVFVKKNLEYTITPQECRQRDATYSGNLYANLKIKISGKVFIFKHLKICKLPLMLQSKNCILSGKNGTFFKSVKECTVDPGGYFIIKGIEKIILIQEQLKSNRIIVEQRKEKPEEYMVSVLRLIIC